MNLKKTVEIKIYNNDTYILEQCDNKIITNEGNKGLIILDNALNRVESVNIPYSGYIYKIFYNFNCTEILIYYPDEKTLIHVNFNNKEIFSIDIKLIEDIFSPLYYWVSNEIILHTYKNQFYKLDITNQKLTKITLSYVQSKYIQLCNFWDSFKNYHNIYAINIGENNFIYKDDEDKSITVFDYLNNKKIKIRDPDLKYYEIVFKNGFFAFVSEKKILIINSKNDDQFIIKDESLVFLRARWLEENGKLFLILAVDTIANNKYSMIIKYELFEA